MHQPIWSEWFPWLVNYVAIDGKFRGMFAALFGVGLVVFIERARARGAPARWLQLRRLWWLAVFGALHYLILFEGDILLQYALLGVVAMWMVFWKPRLLLCIGVLALLLDSTMAGIALWRDAQAEKIALALPVTAPERIGVRSSTGRVSAKRWRRKARSWPTAACATSSPTASWMSTACAWRRCSNLPCHCGMWCCNTCR